MSCRTSGGGRISRQRIAKIIREAAALASETREQQGLPPLPRTTPHTLRRTYISIALAANKFDVKWVMGQVGHADSKMTMDVYAHLQQRLKRGHGEAFDAMVLEAEELMHGEALDEAEVAEEEAEAIEAAGDQDDEEE
jgi:integrase